MRRLFSILLSAFLLLGLAPIANASAGREAGLTVNVTQVSE